MTASYPLAPKTVQWQVDARGIASVTLNRPERSNAMNALMLGELATLLRALDADTTVRMVALRGAGRHFCAGADVAADAAPDGAVDGSAATATVATPTITQLCDQLDRLSKPVIAVVHGACVGGGVAIAACCDIVLAATDAFFAITEVRLGFAAAPLMPFFVRALGSRSARRYVLTAERMTAAEGLRLGFVHRVEPRDALDEALAALADEIQLGAPGAIAASKALIARVEGLPIDAQTLDRLEAEFESSHHNEEAREGVAAFRERRRPGWYRAP